ncbi:MAG TPA: acyl-CoA dehydrogenase family protein [Acidimicrobiales bacterium]|jgi:alkylation response protein AidB-like acyl-CoA dehydrogenase|nr:acyl-CoA dehydrogenase family protein [Acidimicrobiales bacterium]
MNFSFTEEQEDLRGLARKILDGEADPWPALCDAGLVGIALPEAAGGGGFGMMELGVVLEEIGRHVAPVPLLATAIAGRALARAGVSLEGIADGSTLATFAIHDPAGADVRHPAAAGERVGVPHGMAADRLVVTAPDGLYCVDADATGVRREPATATNGEAQARVAFDDGVPMTRLGGQDAIDALWDDVRAAYAATMAGVLDAAVRITASYISEREQFGRPIATFQGATMRLADAYIDVQAASATAWSAIWRLSEGVPASDELAIAAFWACDAGHRVAHACQHLHGGMGVDTDYPIHRYFLWAKAIELALGGATPNLLQIDVEAGV